MESEEDKRKMEGRKEEMEADQWKENEVKR